MRAVADQVRTAPEPTILCVGGAADRNVSAVRRLHERILPRVRRAVPGARLRVAGTVCADLDGPIASDPAVELAGAVERIEEAYRGAWVVAVPSTFGGGTKLKMVEALAAGVPVVGSVNAFQGFDLPAPLDAMVRDDDDAFADAVVEVLTSPERAAELARAGLAFARGHDWSHALAPVLRWLDEDVPPPEGLPRAAAPVPVPAAR